MTYLVVRVQFPFVHYWPGCDWVGKEYLASPHRHMMHVRAWLAVAGDRAIDFIDLKERVEEWLKQVEFPAEYSCERVAQRLIEQFQFARVEVLEDGENGADVRTEEYR